MKKTTKKDFEKRFGEEVTELLVLTKEGISGAQVYKDYLCPSLEFIASVDLKTGILSHEKGHLEWLVKDVEDREDWGFDFKQFEIYHIKARKNIPITLQPYMDKDINNCYMVVEVLDLDSTDERLEKIRKKVAKPVVIEESGVGVFELNREMSSFEGDVDWLGSPCKVFLETDRVDGKTAKKSLAVLKELYLKVQEWDERFRRYAAESLTDEVNEWQQEDGGEDMIPVTEADFAAGLGISELVITPDGDITIYYKGDHMLWEHTVEVDANISDGISDAMFTG